MVDHEGILNRQRTGVEAVNPDKWEMCLKTNAENRIGGIPEALEGADAVVALSTPGPGILKKEWIRAMAENPIVFACANPVPEIWPWEAKEAGAAVVATGRSDFPNQVNNSLGFPGVFRGTLDVRASTITDEMCIAAAVELSNCIKESALRPDRILPTMSDWEIYPRVAAAVGVKATAQKIAGLKRSGHDIYSRAKKIIARSRGITTMMMKKGYIKASR
jgi:malate dehydrogenase (oxaloacetate-decarboxylating)